MAIIKIDKIDKDKFGVKLKFPNRKCTLCTKHPCFENMDKCVSNFAAYGCTYYEEI